MHWSGRRILGILIALPILFSACAPAAAPVADEAATPSAAPEAAETRAPLVTIKIASYNILFGGGSDPALDEIIAPRFRGLDRAPMLMAYLQQLDADIIGLQETTGWDTGTPPYIQVVADQLGMNYVVSTGRSDASLLTRYEILESEDLSTETNSFVRARLRGPDGNPINVFVTHLNSDSMEDRACGTQLLLREMLPYAEERTFLMGDMNFKAKGTGMEASAQALKDGGWQLLVADNRLGIDQLWAPAALEWDATAWSAARGEDLQWISDHGPIGMEVLVFSPAGEYRADALPTPTAMPPVDGLPEAVTAVLPPARLAFAYQAGATCNEQRWTPYLSNANVDGENLHLYGTEGWKADASWMSSIGDNQGMMLDFVYEPDTEFNITLEHDFWGEPGHRKFGMIIGADGQLYADMQKGPEALSGDAWQGGLRPQPGTWYRLLLAVEPEGRLSAFLWDIGDPSNAATYARELGADWAGLKWKLRTAANSGDVDLRGVVQIVW